MWLLLLDLGGIHAGIRLKPTWQHSFVIVCHIDYIYIYVELDRTAGPGV